MGAMGCFPDISKMAESSQPVAILIQPQSRKVKKLWLEKSVTGRTV